MSSSKTTQSSKKRGRPRLGVVPTSTFSGKLQRFLNAKDFFLAAEKFGVTPKAAREFLAGQKLPGCAVLVRLHASTGVDLNWLLDDSDDRPGPVFVRKRRLKAT